MTRIAVFAVVCFVLAGAAAAPQSERIAGFPADLSAAEQKAEFTANTSPSAQVAMRDELALAGRVHRMGQPADYRTAIYVRDRLAADGFWAKIVTYDVANVWPVEQHLEITAPLRRAIDLYEPVIPADPYSADHKAIGKPYSGFSNDGDAQGPLVYANYGTPADFAVLKAAGVQVSGAIVIAKMGRGSADLKGRRVAALGGKALLLYPEPGWDPYIPQRAGAKPYPLGPARPLGAALRNTMLIEYPPGDPLAIGLPVPGAKHAPFSSLRVPPIPVSAISALVAQQLLAGLDGRGAPASWATKVVRAVRLGGAAERVRYVLRSRRFVGPIWDVIATLAGSSAPDEMVVIGGHRDAWTYGAVDPISGTVAMLQFADTLRKLRKTGWRPFRTIVIGSWDGEELNDFGSAAWTQQNAGALRRQCWAYINTDEVAFGPAFFAYATPDLADLIGSSTSAALAPDGTFLRAYWYRQDPKLRVFAPGMGSDHETFTYHLGIPSAGAAYGGEFGTYHSAYDDPASLRIFDPGMRYADAAARFFSVVMLRLADAPYPDVSLNDLASAVQGRLNTFVNAADDPRRAAVYERLEPYAQQFSRLAAAVDLSAARSAASDDLQALGPLRRLTFEIRAKFYASEGIPENRWQSSLLYNASNQAATLPTLETTLDPKWGDAALNQLVGAFASLPPLLLEYEPRHAGD